MQVACQAEPDVRSRIPRYNRWRAACMAVKRCELSPPKSGRGSEYLGGQEGQEGHEVAAVVNKVKSRGILLAVAPRKATKETTKLVGRNKGRPWAVETQSGPHKWWEGG